MRTVQLITSHSAARTARLLLVPLLLSCLPGSHAAEPAARNLLADFRKLADMRPRSCTGWEAPLAPSAAWRLLSEDCAWQGRLRLHRLVAAGDSARNCVGAPAQWWAFTRRAYAGAAGAAPVWYASWGSQSVAGRVQDEHRLAVIERGADGSWVASEWSWKPSPRVHTRRWQQGRWDMLRAQAARLALPAPASEGGLAPLRAAWEASLGARAGEVAGDQWRWTAAGQCLAADIIGASDVKLHLPYLAGDSRLEQRAAMQVQLARRYPGAAWIKPFSLTDAATADAMGGARYKAIWREQSTMRGQLWIPARDGGPLLRLRIAAALPPQAPAQPQATSAEATAARVIDQELEAIARAWGSLHD